MLTMNKKYLLKFPPGRTGLYKIPEGVNTIDENSFTFSNIEEVIMPSTMRNLKTFAFYNSYLKSVDFGSGLERIGSPHPESGVFSQCENLKSISFPKQVNLPQLISGEQKSNGGLFHPHLKGFDESKRVSDTRLLEGLLTVLSFTLFSPGYAVRFPKLSARQRPKSMLIGR